jgi:hypothetical protein
VGLRAHASRRPAGSRRAWRSRRRVPTCSTVCQQMWTGRSNTCSELLLVAILPFYCWLLDQQRATLIRGLPLYVRGTSKLHGELLSAIEA